MSRCECPMPVNVHNGVCGGCLCALKGITHNGPFRAVTYDPSPGYIADNMRLQELNDELVKMLSQVLNSDMAMREEDEGQTSKLLNSVRALLARIEGSANG